MSAQFRMGEFPSDRFDACMAAPLGCSRLRCARCGELVRSQAHWRIPSGGHAATFDRLAAPQPADLSTTWRAYACRCTTFEESNFNRLDLAREAERPVPPWDCSGHPPASLPLTHRGIAVSADASWPFVARAVALLAPEMEVDRYPAADMIWLDVRLEGIPERAAYRRAVAGLLLDDDPLLRSRALQFFHTLPAVPEAEALFAIGNDRVGYAGVQSPSAPVGVTLEDRWLEAVNRWAARLPLSDPRREDALSWRSRANWGELAVTTLWPMRFSAALAALSQPIAARFDVFDARAANCVPRANRRIAAQRVVGFLGRGDRRAADLLGALGERWAVPALTHALNDAIASHRPIEALGVSVALGSLGAKAHFERGLRALLADEQVPVEVALEAAEHADQLAAAVPLLQSLWRERSSAALRGTAFASAWRALTNGSWARNSPASAVHIRQMSPFRIVAAMGKVAADEAIRDALAGADKASKWALSPSDPALDGWVRSVEKGVFDDAAWESLQPTSQDIARAVLCMRAAVFETPMLLAALRGRVDEARVIWSEIAHDATLPTFVPTAAREFARTLLETP